MDFRKAGGTRIPEVFPQQVYSPHEKTYRREGEREYSSEVHEVYQGSLEDPKARKRKMYVTSGAIWKEGLRRVPRIS